MVQHTFPKIVTEFNFNGNPTKLAEAVEANIMPTLRAERDKTPERLGRYGEKLKLFTTGGNRWEFYPKFNPDESRRDFVNPEDQTTLTAFREKFTSFIPTELEKITGVTNARVF